MDLLTELLTTDFRPLDRKAADLYVATVARVKPDALSLPTPCPDWTLHGLLRHQVSQDEGFAAAARGEGGRLSRWRGGDLGDDPHEAARASADLVTRAFADVALDAELVLPEIRDGGAFPASLAIGFHFVDLVVHAWDVAATIGVPWEPAEDLVGAALKVAAIVPEDGRGAGEPFAPSVPSPDGARPEDRLLRMLGRAPGWR
ncbi:TIGR03086 family metal-binding protein [Actinomadura madurae]|uniref:TIGR03086 family metal-binding protein n=1 Tax=Actinomadura madurae TaxID=1993 RepID=UPI0020275A21|nr:TIGR03086 family metal-binding protein [Actinomadura madurae]MCP9954659.1 TIGR03086 family metal-binding protein [Actinomadura madurae]MCP9971393.1 TIGR03086 family metal-binding protein [Actinomadura madurae]MCP9983882.1 TIGR03086 family metal-binding protein [Actinomadura madurae]MCQ0004547.1 TIGR03086 family metal-binding protein [Actinomadura madurae]MCQ0020119.1 TIGR03086 family metal-binding protein [Actinomadura madurae]